SDIIGKRSNSPGEAEPPTKSVAERGYRSTTGKQFRSEQTVPELANSPDERSLRRQSVAERGDRSARG
ncbi:MAG: hypothetical protein WCO89_06500, partial [Syntrophus sp. (in: bacteria)]